MDSTEKREGGDRERENRREGGGSGEGKSEGWGGGGIVEGTSEGEEEWGGGGAEELGEGTSEGRAEGERTSTVSRGLITTDLKAVKIRTFPTRKLQLIDTFIAASCFLWRLQRRAGETCISNLRDTLGSVAIWGLIATHSLFAK